MRKLLWLALLAAAPVCAQDTVVVGNEARRVITRTVSQLPTAGDAGRIFIVRDGQDKTDCTSGAGSTYVFCMDTGSAWTAAAGAGSSAVDGITFELTGISDRQVLCYDGVTDNRVEACDGGITPRVDDDGTVALAGTDRGNLVTAAHATANAVSIAQAGTTDFEAGYYVHFCTRGAGPSTITPTTSTINGDAVLVLNQDSCATIVSDGANYLAMVKQRAGPIGTPNESKINDVATDQDFTSVYTIPANYLAANKCVRVTLDVENTSGTSTVTWSRYLKLGSTKVVTSAANNVTDNQTRNVASVYTICGTAAAGASVAVNVTAAGLSVNNENLSNATAAQSLATNGTLAITPGITFSGTGSTETLTLRSYIIELIP